MDINIWQPGRSRRPLGDTPESTPHRGKPTRCFAHIGYFLLADDRVWASRENITPSRIPNCMAADKDLDRFDREILRLITSDASLSLAEIAGRVGLTPTPCWKRIRRMEQDGIILRSFAFLDPVKFGLPFS